MSILLTASGPLDALDHEIERVASLLRDLQNLRHNRMPPRDVLERAPVLNDWSLAVRTVPCLAGLPYRHPLISGRNGAVTSPLCVLSIELSFARTASRVWRLGPPLAETLDA